MKKLKGGSLMKITALFFLAIIVSGCAPKFNGPAGATFADFAKARTVCYAQLKGQSSSGYIDQSGGFWGSSPSVNCGAFFGCLASKGYTKSEYGSFDSSSISVTCSY
tara:strand:- start:84 stop:404 length:321 start_codon:yes stop_codon:yes gene_type:complete